MQEDGIPIQLDTTIDGFYMDLRGSDIISPFNGLGPYINIMNGTIIARDGGVINLFQENGNGYQDALYPDYHIENVTIFDHGDRDNETIFGKLNTTRGLFKNITKQSLLLNVSNQSNAVMKLKANWRNNYAWSTPQTNVFEGIQYDSPHYSIAEVSTRKRFRGRIFYSKF